MPLIVLYCRSSLYCTRALYYPGPDFMLHRICKIFIPVASLGNLFNSWPQLKTNNFPWRQLRVYLSLASAESIFIPDASWENSLSLSAVAACQASYTHTTLYTKSTSSSTHSRIFINKIHTFKRIKITL